MKKLFLLLSFCMLIGCASFGEHSVKATPFNGGAEITQVQLAQIDKVHADVLAVFKYKTDLEQHGKEDHWVATDIAQLKEGGYFYGDCEDFALSSRLLLDRLEIPSRLVYVKYDNQDHMALEAGGYLLDNRFKTAISRDVVSYNYIKVSSYSSGGKWEKIND